MLKLHYNNLSIKNCKEIFISLAYKNYVLCKVDKLSKQILFTKELIPTYPKKKGSGFAGLFARSLPQCHSYLKFIKKSPHGEGLEYAAGCYWI